MSSTEQPLAVEPASEGSQLALVRRSALPIPAKSVTAGLARDAIRVSDGVALTLVATVNLSKPWLAILLAVTAYALLAAAGTQRPRLSLSALHESSAVVSCALGAGVLWAPLALGTTRMEGLYWQPVISAVILVAARGATYALLRAARRNGRLEAPAIVLGAGPRTEQVVDVLESRREFGLRVVQVSLDGPDGHSATPRPEAVHIIVRQPNEDLEAVTAGLRRLRLDGARAYIVPLPGTTLPRSSRGDVERLRTIPFVRVPASPQRRPSWHLKRILDAAVAAFLLVLFSPVLALAAIAAKVATPGPALFRQPRVKGNGETFTMYKLRTFPVDHIDDKFSRDHTECPTAIGRFLRRTSIDELPQLINVLRGDMSLVGPRPERPRFAAEMARVVPDYEERHAVPGGITGAAQINGLWGSTCIHERVRFDNHYIEEWSFLTDLAILVRTPGALLRKGRR